MFTTIFYETDVNTYYGAVVSGGALAPPEFGSSVNPIPTRGPPILVLVSYDMSYEIHIRAHLRFFQQVPHQMEG